MSPRLKCPPQVGVKLLQTLDAIERLQAALRAEKIEIDTKPLMAAYEAIQARFD